MKYRVTRACYALGRLWEDGQTVEVADSVKVPRWFKPLAAAAAEELPEQPEAEAAQDLEAMSIAELRRLAKSQGIKVSVTMKKAEVIKLIRGEE